MKKLIFMFCVFFSVTTYSEEIKVAYICTAEASTGFIYDQGEWKVSQFTEKDFLIRKFKEDEPDFNTSEKTSYGVFELDDTIPRMYCSIRGFVFHCSGLGQLEFSSRTGRFIRMEAHDYISAQEDAVTQPKITRGTCKPLPPGYKEPPKKVYPLRHDYSAPSK